MFNTFKKKLIALIFLIFGGGFAMAQVAPMFGDATQERAVLTSIENIQFESRGQSGKHRHIPKTIEHGISYEVHEYQTPNGDVGYRVWLRRINSDGDIEEKHIVRGAEATSSYQYNWTVVKEKPATTTLTERDL
jgi:hypothetical protein